jgi:hypothetical protein
MPINLDKEMRIDSFCKAVSNAAKEFGVEVHNRGSGGIFLETTTNPPDFKAALTRDGDYQLFIVYTYS